MAGQLTAAAGATLAAVRSAAADAGWAYGVDLASRDSATVGGTVATNAGGVHVLRHGDTRAQLLGVEAVLGSGAVVSHLGGLLKDNTGYHLPGLLCGSEGTLAVVTAARLRLVAPLPRRTTALLAFGSVADALAASAVLRRSLPSLDACELMLLAGLDLVGDVTGLPHPFTDRHRVALLVEAADQVDPTAALGEAAAWPTGCSTPWWPRSRPAGTGCGGTGRPTPRRSTPWAPPHKLDVTLPAGALADFVDRVPALVASIDPEAQTWLFGHVGDGNIHVNVTGPAPDDDRVDDGVLRLVAELGGSISAEHGIGTAKLAWLHLARSAAEITAFRSIKAALDPDGVLNPHVLLPPVV